MLVIRNGRVFDPANGVDGEVRDVWAAGGQVVPPPADPAGYRVIDATGTVVMPGGVDMHAHIAGPKVNVARKMRPEDRRNAPLPARNGRRSGTLGSTPSTFATGYLYAGMGYTTVFDAAIPPLGARHTHEEFHDTPMIDKGFFVLLGNHHYAMRLLNAGEPERLRHFVAWVLGATRGYAVKVVNPGGVENWKAGHTGHDTGLDTEVSGFGTTPRAILRGLAGAADELGLPHPVHVHCNRLGLPGNAPTTLESMRALDGRRGHFTHVQFHSYGGTLGDQATFRTAVPELADHVNAHPELSVDVGQVVFGETTSMTGDGPLGYYLHRVTGRKWFNGETEAEAGCGIVPITYRDKSLVHALQWAIGLEWYLLVTDPWRIGMSTDHPNGGAFLAYPDIVHLLMKRDYRLEVIARLPKGLRSRCVLPDIEREYTLGEIAIITRAGPARMLGLAHKGHLGVGADADITVYQPEENLTRMFETPRYVVKGGVVIIDGGEPGPEVYGPTLTVEPDFDRDTLADVKAWFESAYTLRFGNYPVTDDYLAHGRVNVACGASRRPSPAASGPPAAR